MSVMLFWDKSKVRSDEMPQNDRVPIAGTLAPVIRSVSSFLNREKSGPMVSMCFGSRTMITSIFSSKSLGSNSTIAFGLLHSV